LRKRELLIPRFRLEVPLSSLRGLSRVLRSGYLTSGRVTREFEAQFADYVGTREAVAVSSGTAALHLALLAAGVQSGSEVILPSFTYHAAASAVVHCNARPVLVDVEPDTMCIDPEAVRNAITGKVRAIIVTHFAGHPCDMNHILEIARKRDLAVIEDAAHAAGAKYSGKAVGSIGRAGCFSLYPTKPLTSGEGGMITTNDDDLARKARLMRSLAVIRSDNTHYDVKSMGFSYRMSELSAALGLSQLKTLDATNSIVRKKAYLLKRKLSGINGLLLPYEAPHVTHIYNLFVVRILRSQFGLGRDEVSASLRRRHIETQLHYVPLHRLSFYCHLSRFKGAALKVSDSLWRTVLSLPLYPTISHAELQRVSDVMFRIAAGL
jgi:dTDP-4-amino-4,6-dideoxygalactose transaminase